MTKDKTDLEILLSKDEDIEPPDEDDGSWRFDYMDDEVVEELMRVGITKKTYEIFLIDVFEDKQSFIEEHLNGDTSIVDIYSDNDEMFRNNYQIGCYWVNKHLNGTHYKFNFPFVVFYHQQHRKEEWTRYVSVDDWLHLHMNNHIPN